MYMKAMRGTSLYSYPYLNYQKPLVILIIVYSLSLTKLEIRAEQSLPGSEEVGGRKRGLEGKGKGGGKGEKCPKHCMHI
jgi:hypothetical protein